MIQIRIGKWKYKGIYSWRDMTLERYSELASIPVPSGYEAFILADGRFNINDKATIDYYCDAVSQLTDKEIKEDFPAYYRRVILCLTNIPDSLLDMVGDEKIEQLYDSYFKPFVMSLLYNMPLVKVMGQVVTYQPPKVDYLQIGYRRYYLPQSVVIDGEEIQLAKEPAVSFIEALDIFKGRMTKDDIQRLARLMAIYCRRMGEKYDESKVLEREEMFMQVPMSLVWTVFFYTLRRIPGYGSRTRLYGSLRRTMAETVSVARIYKGMAAVH